MRRFSPATSSELSATSPVYSVSVFLCLHTRDVRHGAVSGILRAKYSQKPQVSAELVFLNLVLPYNPHSFLAPTRWYVHMRFHSKNAQLTRS